MTPQEERAAISAVVDHWVGIGEDFTSVRGPGWYEASCGLCPWFTTGRQPVVEDAAYDHVGQRHQDRWR